MSGWTDAHCHLQEQYLSGDVAARSDVRATLERSRDAGVNRVVVIGTDATTSREALALAQENVDGVEIYATVGLHPHDASQGVDAVADLARAGSPRLVGIGECGLDYFYEHSPRQTQRDVFCEQISLAHELSLALVIHARDAWDDLFAILRAEGVPERTVIHCFTGGPEEATTALELGCDLSVSGVITFKNAQPTRDAVTHAPLDRLHVETDSPFLAPVPHRGQRNEPAYVAAVGAAVAALRHVPVAEVQQATARNSTRLFGLG